MVETLCFTRCFVPDCPRFLSGDSSVSSARHKQVVPHAFRRRLVRLTLPAVAATVVTAGIVGVAVGAGGSPDPVSAAADARAAASPLTVDLDSAEPSAEPSVSPYLAARTGAISRSAKRVTLQPEAGGQGPRVHDDRPEPLGGAEGEGQAPRRAPRGQDRGDHRRREERLRADPARRPGPLGQRRLPHRRQAGRAVSGRGGCRQLLRHRRRRHRPRRGLLGPLRGRLGHRVRPDQLRGPAVPRGLQRLPGADHLRRLRRPRRAQLRTRDRLHDQRPLPGAGRRGLGARARLGARPLRHPLGPAHLDAGALVGGLALDAGPRLVRPRTTSTTCTSRSTDRPGLSGGARDRVPHFYWGPSESCTPLPLQRWGAATLPGAPGNLPAGSGQGEGEREVTGLVGPPLRRAAARRRSARRRPCRGGTSRRSRCASPRRPRSRRRGRERVRRPAAPRSDRSRISIHSCSASHTATCSNRVDVEVGVRARG